VHASQYSDHSWWQSPLSRKAFKRFTALSATEAAGQAVNHHCPAMGGPSPYLWNRRSNGANLMNCSVITVRSSSRLLKSLVDLVDWWMAIFPHGAILVHLKGTSLSQGAMMLFDCYNVVWKPLHSYKTKNRWAIRYSATIFYGPFWARASPQLCKRPIKSTNVIFL